MENQSRLNLLLGALAFVALVTINILLVKYETAKIEAHIVKAIAAEGEKTRSWELAQSLKARSYNEHAHCYVSGTGQWPQEATTSDCSEDIKPNFNP